MLKMNEQEIYQKIGELLWSIMPNEAIEIYFIGDIYPEHYSGGAEWRLKNGNIDSFPFGERAYEIEENICGLIKELRSLELFIEKWTNYKITLTEEGKFNIEFAYIPEEYHWPTLYMRRVSDLKEEELDQYYIPIEEWKKRLGLRTE